MDYNNTTLVETDDLSIIYIRQPFTSRHAILVSIYSILFTVGVIGNFWVARVVGMVLCYGRVENVPRSVQFFIFALCMSDILILISMLLILMDMLMGQWIFGSILCVLFVCFDMINKFFAPFLLAVLSATCYASICRADQTQWLRSISFAFSATAFCFVVALILVIPAFLYTDVIEFELKPKWTPQGQVRRRIRKCGFDPTPAIVFAFTTYGTLIGYLIPMCSFCYFYARIALFVRNHSRTVPMRTVPFWRVGKLILGLVFVYVCCWTPFWVGTWLAFFIDLNNMQVMVMMMTHILPYISCTIYPVIYTFMNRGIQDAHARISAQHKRRVTSNADSTAETGFLHPELSISRLSFKSLRNSFRSSKSSGVSFMSSGHHRHSRRKKEVERNGSMSYQSTMNSVPLMNKTSKSVSRSGSRRKSDASGIRPQFLTPTIDIYECSSSEGSSCINNSSIVDFESTL